MLCVHSRAAHQEVSGCLRVLQLYLAIAWDNDHDQSNRWLEAHTNDRQAEQRMEGLPNITIRNQSQFSAARRNRCSFVLPGKSITGQTTS